MAEQPIAEAPGWHRPCPVCGDDRPLPVFTNALARLDGLDMSYRVAQCPNCAFAYASDLPTPQTYAEYYRRLSKYDVPTAEGDLPPLVRSRIEAAVALCRPHLPARAAVADIGCGSGALLHAFRDAGHLRLYGIDPAPSSAAEAQRRFGLTQVRVGTLRDAATLLPLDEIGLLCLTGVLEHLPRLADDLDWLCGQLPDDACLLVEVPAMERFLAEPLEPFGEFSLEHIQYFTADTLTRLMAKFGFHPRELSILPLQGCTDSLFGIFSRQASPRAPAAATPILTAYVERCEAGMASALGRVAANPGAFVIFGAGSHSARLLPRLQAAGLAERILGIVDNNPNLQGKKLGAYPVHPATFLADHPGVPVLVSSFHGQAAIAGSLAGRHQAIQLYDRTA